MLHVGAASIVTVVLQLLVHPAVLVIVTEQEPAVETVIHCVLAPVLHEYELIPVGAQSCVLPPEQIEVLPDILHIGAGSMVTVALQLLVHPDSLVIVTEYDAAVVAVIH